MGSTFSPNEKNHVSMLHGLFQINAPASVPVAQASAGGSWV